MLSLTGVGCRQVKKALGFTIFGVEFTMHMGHVSGDAEEVFRYCGG